MEIEVTFPGGSRVDASFNGFSVPTDQSAKYGGQGSAPEPFAYFLASLATCAGIFVLRFLETRNIPTEGLKLVQRVIPKPDGKGLGKIEIDIQVGPEFPEKYEKAVIRAAELCAVKKVIMDPPEFDIQVKR